MNKPIALIAVVAAWQYLHNVENVIGQRDHFSSTRAAITLDGNGWCASCRNPAVLAEQGVPYRGIDLRPSADAPLVKTAAEEGLDFKGALLQAYDPQAILSAY
jgi:hypothetical protein